jgi:NitT/TauT family transport system permease protein
MMGKTKREDLMVLAGRVAVIGLSLLVWEGLAGGLGSGLRVIDPVLFSRPSLVARDLYVGFARGEFQGDLIFTVEAALAGLALGMTTGIMVGLLFAYSKWLSRLLDPLMVAFNSLPRPALGPVLVLVFGLGITSKIVLSWSIVFFVVFYNTYIGVLSVDPDLIKVTRVMGGSKTHIFRHVIVPSVFSWVFAALRVSVAFALVGAVVGEFVGSTKGLGYEMEAARGVLNSDRVYAVLFILMMVGVVLTEASKLVETRLLRWRPPSVAL